MRKKFVVLSVFFTVFFLLACAGKTGREPIKVYATEFDFSPYSGKVIRSIQYCDGCAPAGDDLIISFTDGTTLKVYAYKYVMKIY
jgi:hypothetical protein